MLVARVPVPRALWRSDQARGLLGGNTLLHRRLIPGEAGHEPATCYSSRMTVPSKALCPACLKIELLMSQCAARSPSQAGLTAQDRLILKTCAYIREHAPDDGLFHSKFGRAVPRLAVPQDIGRALRLS